jgi:hypothetical protein
MKRPELKRLKKSTLKLPKGGVPPFLSDLFFDLRDRRLLPLIALIVVAIAAVPFLLGGDSDAEQGRVPPVRGASASASAAAAETPILNVVAANPGLRDYRKRLRRRTPTDPFKPRYVSPVLSGSQLPPEPTISPTNTPSPTVTAAPPIELESPPPSSGSVPRSQSGSVAGPDLTYFAFVADLKITLIRGGEASGEEGAAAGRISAAEEPAEADAGQASKDEPTIRHGVRPATPLPGLKTSTVTYLEAIRNATTAVFMVSPEVISVTGEGKCLSETSSCQLMGVKVGQIETFVYGFNHNRLRISVLKIEPVVTGHS